jgi:hypothetical protein
MTRFDDNLWREIERGYGSQLSGANGPLSSGPRRRLPVIAGASLAVAGASAAAVLILGAASSSPAFAVTTHSDGTVSLVIHRLDGIPGANRRLAQLGIHVRAVQVDAQCQVAVAPALRHVTIATFKRDRRAGWVGGVVGGVNARIRPAQIARNHTLVIAAVPNKGQVRLVRGRAVRGAIPGCLPPVARLRGNARWVRPRVVSCAISPVPSRHPIVVVSPGSNTTATNETTSTAPGSGPAAMESTTNWTTTTGPSTATAATTGTTSPTGSGTTTSSSPAGATPVQAPPVLQACLNAARRAARVQKVPRGSARARR